MLDPFELFVLHETMFPEEGGLLGVCQVSCPSCDASFELEVDPGNPCDVYRCSHCDRLFVVDWVAETVTSADAPPPEV